ncbi:MAG TPA: pitrilysin family protein [Candidatus Cloacimonadota bacterium]|nr:pitrilysin family protein [Candidatus Cloacimonadota bacterium]HQB40179.1 pitrilysin family protein [Candidatus Cloacimonadota bacterium]
MRIKHFILDNGLKVICAKDDSHPIVNLQLHIKVGSNWESDEEEGFSHLLEHLVFKSTSKYPSNKIVEKASDIGAYINAYTENDSTCFHLSLPSNKISKGLEILSQLIIYSNFTEEDFMSEKGVVIEELKQYKNDKEDYFAEQIPRLYFKNSPYSKPIIGSLKALKKSTAEQLRLFYKKYYSPQNCFISIAGDINFADTKRRIEKYFTDWYSDEQHSLSLAKHIKKYSSTAPQGYNEELNHSIYTHFQQKMKGYYLAFAFPEYSERSKYAITQTLLTKIFTTGNNSILYKRLFIKEKLVDDIKVYSYSGILNGLCYILIFPRKMEYANAIIKIFFEEIQSLLSKKITMDELEHHCKELEYSYYYSFEYMEELNNNLAYEEIIYEYQEFFNYINNIKRVKPSDLMALAKDVFRLDRIMIASSGKKPLDINQIQDILQTYKQNCTPQEINNDLFIEHSKSLTQVKTISTHIKKTNNKSDFFEHVLPNGISLFMKKVAQKDVCGISLALKSSQLYENHAQLGLNQLSSTMLLYGNKKMKYNEFLEYCINHGILFSVSCSKENTKLKLKCFSNHLYESLDLLSNVLYQPTFPKEHFKNVKRAITNNIQRYSDYPETMAIYSWKQLLFGMHSNLLGKDGQVETLRTFSVDDCIEWHKNHLINCKANLVITGNLDFDKTIQVCNEVFVKGNHLNENPHSIISDISPAKQKHKVVKNGADQSIIYIGGFSCLYAETQERSALLILSQIVGGDLNSRLFKELREKRGIAYSIGFDFDSLAHTGYFRAYAVVDKMYEDVALDVIYEVLYTIRQRGVSLKEFNSAKQYIRGLSFLEEEGVLSQAQILSALFLENKDYEYYLNREQRLKMISKDNLQVIAEKYFKPELLYTLVYN